MTSLTASPVKLLAAPLAPQASGNILDPQKLVDGFLLDFLYEGKAPDQRIDIHIEVKVDRFSPPQVWVARFDTRLAGEEQVELGTSMFSYRFQDGQALISYCAEIGGIPTPSGTLVLSIVDTP
jgi:hypothetical protein